MKLYKLTDKDGYTRRGEFGETKWEMGANVSVPACWDPSLCSPDVIHAYLNPNLALLLNPIHANIDDPKLWECDGDVCVQDWGKCGTFSLTVRGELPLPGWFVDDRQRHQTQVLFAILCAESVLSYYEDKYPGDSRARLAIEAARNYLGQSSTETARAAAADAADAAYAAAADAAYAAAYAADAAYAAAAAAADAADAAAYAYAADAADAADAAYAAAAAAADAAADAAAADAAALDLCALADRAVQEITK